MLVLLCVIDGFGLREPLDDNAIAAANKPNYNKLISEWPHTKIDCSGLSVGLPDGQMGNSEVGHLNLGAGRVVYQEITRIDKTIENGDFFNHKLFCESFEKAVTGSHAVHLFGLLSDGKVHSSLDHLYALVDLAKGKQVNKLYLHAFLDGRDTPPDSGKGFMERTLSEFDRVGLGKVATIGGRYYGMDRDTRWERLTKAFNASVYGEGEKFTNPVEAIQKSYDNNVTDEFMIPVVIDNGAEYDGRVKDGDICIFFNFRSDRARQFTFMLSGLEHKGYKHEQHPDIELITMTSYDVNLHNVGVAFPPNKLNNILGDILSRSGKRQLRTAETEKYAHVTFFFNGGVEEPFKNEDRDLIPSPRIATYDLKPEMSSVEVTDNVVRRIESGQYDFILINYANCDMVGHSGFFDAAKSAVEAVDAGLGRILEAVKNQKGIALITADHGNAEMMINPATGGPWTAHTTNPVPFIFYDPTGKLGDKSKIRLAEGGILADVAPTVLDILNMEKPEAMTGKSLIIRK